MRPYERCARIARVKARANWHPIEKIQELMRYTGFDDDQGDPIFFEDYVAYVFYDVDDASECHRGIGRIVESMSKGVAFLADGYIQDIWDDEDMWRFRVLGNYYQNRVFEQWANYHPREPEKTQSVGELLLDLMRVLQDRNSQTQPSKLFTNSIRL